MSVKTYQSLPTRVEAIQFLGTENVNECLQFLSNGGGEWQEEKKIVIHTLEGTMTASIGDWIVKGIKGEFYPVKPEIFSQRYEEVPSVDKPKEEKKDEDPKDNTTGQPNSD